MKMFNNKTMQVEELPKLLKVGNINKYTNKLTEEELNSIGYFRISSSDIPDKRYYKQGAISYEIVNNKAIKTIEAIELPIDTIKRRMLNDVSKSFKQVSQRPKVDTGLGFSVDGSKEDLLNFEIGKEYNLPSIKDADGNIQSIISDDYDIIIKSIKDYGLKLYQEKWIKESAIELMETVEELIRYEREPYTVSELIIDEQGLPILDEDGNEQYKDVIKYKNNVTEW